ncbi:MAG: fucose isomerase [Clostridia bacterium]|nr:fucose isomerase [Clostridia bacterium]
MAMSNIPNVKIGMIAVSRDCFPIALSEARRKAVAEAYVRAGGDIHVCPVTVENENDAVRALADVNAAGCNALVVFLGNFGPEAPETILAQRFAGPTMCIAAAEENGKDLFNERGDAYCGMLNCSYNLGLRRIRAFIPEYPVGTSTEVAAMIAEFIPVARTLIGLSRLKIFSFGPRPQDFFACNAPIQPLYDLGVEIQENSELDLLASYREHAGDARIPGIVAEMAAELGLDGNRYPELLPRMAQHEITLLDWADANKGSREYFVFANKCWPAFPKEFSFMPCYVNSRLASRGIPVSCEVDIYGALSEYIGACVTEDAVTLLDINNTVPSDIFKEDIQSKYPQYTLRDMFMGFHCGNTPICKLKKGGIKYQLIMNRLMENSGEPDFTRGTLEGDMAPSDVTFYRLQGNAEGKLTAYIAEGEVLDVPTRSFGGIGIVAIPEMGRFYRHVLVQKRYPHHGALAFAKVGKALFSIFTFLGVQDIGYNQPKGVLYPSENPFA